VVGGLATCLLSGCEEGFERVAPDRCVPEGQGQCLRCNDDTDCEPWLSCRSVGVARFCVLPCDGPEACRAAARCREPAPGEEPVCLEATGGCDRGSCAVHEDCEDLDPCTDDRCERGRCEHPPTDCDDGDPCTEDACVPGSGCRFTPRDDHCDDGDP